MIVKTLLLKLKVIIINNLNLLIIFKIIITIVIIVITIIIKDKKEIYQLNLLKMILMYNKDKNKEIKAIMIS